MSVSVDTLITQFKVAGHGDVISAFARIGVSANATAAAVTGLVAAAGGIAALGTHAVKTAANFEMLRARLNGVFKSAKAGRDAFNWADKFEKETPFKLAEVVEGMTAMKALGGDPFRDLRTLGDAAAALGLGADGIRRINMQMGQMRAQNRVLREDLKILAEAGIPVFEILKRELGLTDKQIQNIGESNIDVTATLNALLNGMDKAYGGAMANQMETIIGKVSNLEGAMDRLSALAGNVLLPTVTDVVDKLTKDLSNTSVMEEYVRFFAYLVETGKAVIDVVSAWGSAFKSTFEMIAAMGRAMVAGLLSGFNKIQEGMLWVVLQGTKLMRLFGGGQWRVDAAQGEKDRVAEQAAFWDRYSQEQAKSVGDILNNGGGRGLLNRMAGIAFDGIEGRIDGIVKKVMGQGMAGRDMPDPKGRAGGRPTGNPFANAPGSGGLTPVVEALLLGGGMKARAAMRGLNSLRTAGASNPPPVEVRVKLDGRATLDEYIKAISEKAAAEAIKRYQTDSRYRNIRGY